MVAVRHLSIDPRAPLDVEAARAEVERLQAGLPATLLAARPEQLRRLARTALDAERAALRRRSKIGDEPDLDVMAADAAVAAHDAVLAARAGLRDATNDGMRWLAIGNAWGIAGLAAAAAMVLKAGYEPMATPVYAAVAAGAAGPLATTALGLTRRSVAALRVTASTSAWAAALAASGFATMGELSARRIAHIAWRRRGDEAAAANAVARDARAAWHRVAGPHHHPRHAPALVDQLARLRAAQLDLLEALLIEHVCRIDEQEAAPFAITWAGAAPVMNEPRSRRPLSFRFWRR